MTNTLDLDKINAELREQSPQDIIKWALALNKNTIVTTNFGPHEAAILHMVNEQAPEMPVICVDHAITPKPLIVLQIQSSKSLTSKCTTTPL
jgi:phosphoadenosine phosphosulfate reductase